MAYTLGIDYGTNSVRALVVDCADGSEVGTGVVDYPSGKQGILLDPRDHHLARQHPGDYLFGLEEMRATGAGAGGGRSRLFRRRGHRHRRGYHRLQSRFRSMPATSPLALSRHGKTISPRNAGYGRITPAHAEAARITALAAEHRPHFIAKCGNAYSSEWFWARSGIA